MLMLPSSASGVACKCVHKGITEGHMISLFRGTSPLVNYPQPTAAEVRHAGVWRFSTGSRSCPNLVIKIFRHTFGCVTIMSIVTSFCPWRALLLAVAAQLHRTCSTDSSTPHPSSHRLSSVSPMKWRYRFSSIACPVLILVKVILTSRGQSFSMSYFGRRLSL